MNIKDMIIEKIKKTKTFRTARLTLLASGIGITSLAANEVAELAKAMAETVSVSYDTAVKTIESIIEKMEISNNTASIINEANLKLYGDKSQEEDLYLPAFSGHTAFNSYQPLEDRISRCSVNYSLLVSKFLSQSELDKSKQFEKVSKNMGIDIAVVKDAVNLASPFHFKIMDAILEMSHNHEYNSYKKKFDAPLKFAVGFDPVDKSDPQFTLVPGVYLLFGSKGQAKSELAYHFIDKNESAYERVLEPEGNGAKNLNEGMFYIHHWANNNISMYPDAGKEILIFDSTRLAFYIQNKLSSTTSGGVNGDMYTSFSDLNNLIRLTGKTLIMVVNPLANMSVDIPDALESSVMGFIVARGYGACSLVTRTENTLRKEIFYNYQPKEAVIKRIKKAEVQMESGEFTYSNEDVHSTQVIEKFLK